MPYETVTVTADCQIRVKKKGVEFAGAHIRIAPTQDQLVQLKSEVPLSELPERFAKACFEGIREHTEVGIIEGHPIRGIEVTLLAAEYRLDASTEEAFKVAGGDCFRLLLHKAEPIVIDD